MSNHSTVGTGLFEQEDMFMFDKMIESNTREAEFKPRGNFFLVSSVVVGILFLTTVVVSLYAQDFSLGTDNFDVVELLAPVAPDAPQPPEPSQQTTQNTQSRSDVPQRTVNMPRLNENPIVPTSISVTPNTEMARPAGRFNPGPIDLDPSGPPSDGIARPGGTGSGPLPTQPAELETEAINKVPPPIHADPPKPPKSEGVINGKATYLPKPLYTSAAQMMGAQGEVSVQVTVDESGKVISSRAVSGHPMLRGPSEKAAWSARFSPTYLSKIPVKVTGVIIYRFNKN